MRERKDFTPNFILESFYYSEMIMYVGGSSQIRFPAVVFSLCRLLFINFFFEKKNRRFQFGSFFCSLHTSKSTFIFLCDYFVFIFEWFPEAKLKWNHQICSGICLQLYIDFWCFTSFVELAVLEPTRVATSNLFSCFDKGRGLSFLVVRGSTYWN